jgi:hypothetical protein
VNEHRKPSHSRRACRSLGYAELTGVGDRPRPSPLMGWRYHWPTPAKYLSKSPVLGACE